MKRVRLTPAIKAQQAEEKQSEDFGLELLAFYRAWTADVKIFRNAALPLVTRLAAFQRCEERAIGSGAVKSTIPTWNCVACRWTRQEIDRILPATLQAALRSRSKAMPHFDQQGNEEFICQLGGHVATGDSVWRPELVGRTSAATCCKACAKRESEAVWYRVFCYILARYPRKFTVADICDYNHPDFGPKAHRPISAMLLVEAIRKLRTDGRIIVKAGDGEIKLTPAPGPNTVHAVFEDLARAYVGPFNSIMEANRHAEFCVNRGDGGVYLHTIPSATLPEDAFVQTPEEDRFFDPSEVMK